MKNVKHLFVLITFFSSHFLQAGLNPPVVEQNPPLAIVCYDGTHLILDPVVRGQLATPEERIDFTQFSADRWEPLHISRAHCDQLSRFVYLGQGFLPARYEATPIMDDFVTHLLYGPEGDAGPLAFYILLNDVRYQDQQVPVAEIFGTVMVSKKTLFVRRLIQKLMGERLGSLLASNQLPNDSVSELRRAALTYENEEIAADRLGRHHGRFF